MYLKFVIISTTLLIASAGFYFSFTKTIRDGIVIETVSGPIKGVIEVSRDGRNYFSWYRIPFARPPVDELRFADPLPPQNWKNVLDGRKIGPACAQINLWRPDTLGSIVGKEDCLHLNIHVPSKAHEDITSGSRAKLPVIFYIHGGGYIVGSNADFSPAYFMDKDVVTVAINYRLDLLGFLTTGDKSIRGNMALKDQNMALKWVQKNIQYFGGDPNQVTIFGTSAGAGSAHMHMLSQKSKGLFHKVLARSGVASASWSFNSLETSVAKTNAIAIKLKCSSNDTQILADCLRKAPLQDLLMTRLGIKTDWIYLNPHQGDTVFGPISEAIADEHAFLTADPIKIIREGKAHRVPLMIGHTTHEGLFISSSFIRDPDNIKKFEAVRSTSLKTIFRGWNPKWKEIMDNISTFYFPNDQDELTYDEKLEVYTKLFNNALLDFDVRETVLHQRQYSPVYYYLFNKTDTPDPTKVAFMASGKWPFVTEAGLFILKSFISEKVLMIPPKYHGIGHALDSLYFYPVVTATISQESKLYPYSKDLVKLAVDFATDDKKMVFRGVKFPAVSKTGDLDIFEFKNEHAAIVPEPNKKTMEYLNSLDIRGVSDHHQCTTI